MCMESLVRRLVRIFSPETETPDRKLPEQTLRKMAQLEKALAKWVEKKGWRTPSRTIGEVAEGLGTDSETLFHYFEQRMGVDFRTWRTRLRLEDAKSMLRERPDLPASEVARRVGFSDRSNFSRQFLAYTGLTPNRWRERQPE